MLTWLICLPRMIPPLSYDRGAFVSVAGRLLAGDRLYADVWDNKDPVFYYAIALGRTIGPFGDVVVEALWIGLACFGAWRIARRLRFTASLALVSGFALTTIALTGSLDEPGYSHLPGVAVTLLIVGAVVHGRTATAGALAGLLLFTKLVMMPLAAVVVVAILLLQPQRRAVRRIALGFAAACATLLVIMLARGELAPYLHALQLNVGYSQSSLLRPGVPGPIAHLLRVVWPPAIVTSAATVIALVLVAPAAARSRRSTDRATWCLWVCTAGTFVAAIAVLAVTGLWSQHDQILLVPVVLAVLLAVARLRSDFELHRFTRRRAGRLLVLVVATVLIAGSNPIAYGKAFQAAPATAASLITAAPEAQALDALASSGTYARIGGNDDFGSGYDLRDWKLVCSHFAQYTFDPAPVLAQTARCLHRAEYVIVSRSATAVPGQPVWNRFLGQIRSTLQAQYACTHSHGVLICERRPA